MQFHYSEIRIDRGLVPNYGTKDITHNGSLIHQYTESGKIDYDLIWNFSTSKISIDELKSNEANLNSLETSEAKPEINLKQRPKTKLKAYYS